MDFIFAKKFCKLYFSKFLDGTQQIMSDNHKHILRRNRTDVDKLLLQNMIARKFKCQILPPAPPPTYHSRAVCSCYNNRPRPQPVV